MIHMYTFIGVIASYIYEIKLSFIVSFITPTHDDPIMIAMICSNIYDGDKILITLECSDSTSD